MRFLFLSCRFAALLLCAFLSAHLPARAQTENATIEKFEVPAEIEDVRTLDPEPDMIAWAPVSRRSHLEFQPKGFIAGLFNVLPYMRLEEEFDSNIYASERAEVDDFITRVSPGFSMETVPGSKHTLKMAGRLDAVRYAANENENHDDTLVSAGWAFEAAHDLVLSLSGSHGVTHKDRPDVLSERFTRNPLRVSEAQVETGAAYTFNRLKASLGLRRLEKRFDNDVSLTDANRLVVQDDGDFNTHEATVQFDYEFPVDHKAFLKFTAGDTDYLRRSFVGLTNSYSGTNRDSRNWAAFAGWQSNYKGLLVTEAAFGVENKDFNDNAIDDVRNWAANAQLFWNVTRLTTLGLNFRRGFVEDNDVIDGLLVTRTGIALDHELRRNWTAGLGFEQVNRAFENSTREDDIYRYALTTRYQCSPYLWLFGELSHADLESTDPARSFSKDTAMLRLLAQY